MSFSACGLVWPVQNGPFCVFPTDYFVGEGETVFINVEYLPSAVGVHEARFVMVQVKTATDFHWTAVGVDMRQD